MSRRAVFVAIAVLLILSPATALAALVAEYNFSGNPNDSSGNALHGTNNGAALTIDRFGNASSAYSFDGSATIEVPHNPLLNATTGEWSMSAWIKSTQGEYILGMGGTTTGAPPRYSYFLGAFPPGSGGRVGAGAWCCDGGEHMTAHADSAIILDGQWHHIVGTIKNNDNAKLYVDGNLVATDDPSSGTGPWNINVVAPFWIGDVKDAAGGPFVGVIDDVRLFNHVLSESEVAALYAAPEASTMVLSLAAIAVGVHARRRFAQV